MQRARRGAPVVLLLAVYPPSQAGTRLRLEQHVPYLRAAGAAPTLWTLLDERSSRALFSGARRIQRAVVAGRCLMRLFALAGMLLRLRKGDVVVVHREALPVASTLVERWAARRAQLIWDVDDAVWEAHDGLFVRGILTAVRGGRRKYEGIAALADEVWAGSDHLASWCSQRAGTVWVLPTVVPLPKNLPSRRDRSGSVWTGSPSTEPFVDAVLPHLPGHVTVLGGARRTQDGVSRRAWSPIAEDSALRAARVGLYPVELTHPLAQGKAGLKAVLYLSYGLPCVVTPTSTLARLIRDGVDGLHASSDDEWRASVGRLLEDDELWDQMSAAARRRSHDWSAAVWGPRVADRVLSLAKQTS